MADENGENDDYDHDDDHDHDYYVDKNSNKNVNAIDITLNPIIMITQRIPKLW